MNLKESIKKHLILEKRIGQIASNFEISFGFDIITTKHSNYRSGGRDLEDYNQRPISNAEIVEFIQMFKKDIAEKIINTEIENGIPFIIISNKWELAMAVSPEKIYGTYWKLVVITVFRQSEIHQFRVGIDQIVIEK
jgi:predicted HNH restriction endonuclease